MQDLVKTIRKKLNLSQEQIASLMGISPVTVNRWENGNTKPSKITIINFKEFCENKNINIKEA